MNATECIKGRRSIRKFKEDAVDPSIVEEIIETASYAPSWKHTQITRYIAVTGELKDKIGDCTSAYPHNGEIIKQAPLLMVITAIKNRSGFERDGSFSTTKKDGWQMFDAGVASQSYCLSAYEHGLGTVIMGIYDEDKISDLLGLGDDRMLVCLIPTGYPDEAPVAPKRKEVSELLTFK